MLDGTATGLAEYREAIVAPKARSASFRERKQIVAAIATLTELPFVQVPFELDDDDLRTLMHLTGLEELTFKTRGLTDAGVASILKFRKIIDLTIDFDRPDCLPIDVVAKLSELPRLETVSTARLPNEMLARIKLALPRVRFIDPAPDD